MQWNPIPLNLVKSLFNSYLDRVKKIYELKGGSFDMEYLNNFKQNKFNITYSFQKTKQLPNIRMVYNDDKLNMYKQNEIRNLKKQINSLKIIYKNKNTKKYKQNNKKKNILSFYRLENIKP